LPNGRLEAEITDELAIAREVCEASGRPARVFLDFRWRTLDSWSRERRVIGKAEWTGDKANPRFIVTSLKKKEGNSQYLYEVIYRAHGEMENRIKECQLDLSAGKTTVRNPG
jgi:Transposase DDE domain group 1